MAEARRQLLFVCLILITISIWRTIHKPSALSRNTKLNEKLSVSPQPSQEVTIKNQTLAPSLKVASSISESVASPVSLAINSDNRDTTANNLTLFLKYQLHQNQPYNLTFSQNIVCTLGRTTNKWGRRPITRLPLAPPFKDILNLITTFQTNLKILSIGDSVGIQFHEILEEAAGVRAKHVYENAWGDHELVSVSAPINGGGVLAALRMTGFLLESGKGLDPPNAPPNRLGVGGWLPEHIGYLKNHKYTMKTNSTGIVNNQKVVGSFDAMILRIPHGWVTLDVITVENLKESLRFARELFGVHTAIVQNLYLNNNVKTMDDLQQMNEINDMIHEIVVESWADSSLPKLLLMDFGGWTDGLVHLNAQLAGMNQSLANYTLARLGCLKYAPTLAMSCVDKVSPGKCACIRNMLSVDGMHWCMESMGGRIVAAIACLLKCSLAVDEEDGTKENNSLRRCEQQCNEQFMSLRNVSTLLATEKTEEDNGY